MGGAEKSVGAVREPPGMGNAGKRHKWRPWGECRDGAINGARGGMLEWRHSWRPRGECWNGAREGECRGVP